MNINQKLYDHAFSSVNPNTSRLRLYVLAVGKDHHPTLTCNSAALSFPSSIPTCLLPYFCLPHSIHLPVIFPLFTATFPPFTCHLPSITRHLASIYPDYLPPSLHLLLIMFTGLSFCIFSLVCSIVLGAFDWKAEKITRCKESGTGEKISIRDVKDFPLRLWVIFIICVAYYVTVFPFIGLAT